jgi:hypothetical protein
VQHATCEAAHALAHTTGGGALGVPVWLAQSHSQPQRVFAARAIPKESAAQLHGICRHRSTCSATGQAGGTAQRRNAVACTTVARVRRWYDCARPLCSARRRFAIPTAGKKPVSVKLPPLVSGLGPTRNSDFLKSMPLTLVRVCAARTAFTASLRSAAPHGSLCRMRGLHPHLRALHARRLCRSAHVACQSIWCAASCRIGWHRYIADRQAGDVRPIM